MKPFAATIAGAVLAAGSTVLLSLADEASDAAAIGGATGLVISGALFGLTFLVWRWRSGAASYTETLVDSAGLYEELAATFDDEVASYADATAV